VHSVFTSKEIAMRTLHSALLAGVAAAAIGISGAALAQSSNVHVMTVRLPDGGVAQVRYTGNVAPQVSFSDGAAPLEMFAPMPSMFGPNSPFAQLERISAEMDRQAAAMFQRANAIAAAARSGQSPETAMRSLPPDSQGYSFISTMSGSGVCMQSVQITSPGNGGQPHVVSHSSGDCGPSGGANGSVSLPTATPPAGRSGPIWVTAPTAKPYVAPTPTNHPDVVWTAAHGARPYAGLVEPIPPAQR
jgi:hypothetical protein